MSVATGKHIVLVGAGHAHLHVIRHAQTLIRAGAKITLVAPDIYWYYSGMATEVLSGYYGVKDFRVDLRTLTEKNGVEFCVDEVTSILPEHKRLITAAGRTLDYNWASFAIGSIPLEREGDVPVDGSFPLQPVRNIIELRNEVETLLELETEKTLSFVILGGGAAGVETALNLASLLKQRTHPAGVKVTLLESKGRVLSGFPAAASKQAYRKLVRLGVQVRTQAVIQHVQSGRVVLDRGETMDFDLAVVTMGVRVPELLEKAMLFTDEGGALVVERTLRSHEHPEFFATGDCARVMGLGLMRLGVHAVAQGPVLLHNLLAVLQGGKLKQVTHTQTPLQIVSLGPNDALWIKGSTVLNGRWAVWLKHFIDKRYVRQYQVRLASGPARWA